MSILGIFKGLLKLHLSKFFDWPCRLASLQSKQELLDHADHIRRSGIGHGNAALRVLEQIENGDMSERDLLKVLLLFRRQIR